MDYTVFFYFRKGDGMKIVIIGAGALGSLFAAKLRQTQCNVMLFDYKPTRARSLNNRLSLQVDKQKHTITLPVTAEPSCLGHADLVLLCTKSGHVNQGLDLFKQYAPDHALILGFQNGIHHIDAIAQIPRGGFGVTAQGATLLKPGHIRHGGHGPTVIGRLDHNTSALEPVAQLFCAAGIPTTVTAQIKDILWQKLLINVGINGLTVLHNCPNGELLNIPEAKERLIALVEEGVRVAQAISIKTSENPVQDCLRTCEATATNISSMLQDFRQQKQSEIMAINGALMHEAQKAGIATPENDLLIQNVLTMWSQNTRDTAGHR